MPWTGVWKQLLWGEGGGGGVHSNSVSGNGRPCLEPIECALESMLTGARVRGEVTERGRG